MKKDVIYETAQVYWNDEDKETELNSRLEKKFDLNWKHFENNES